MATYDFTPKANSLSDLPSVGGNNVVGTLETTGALSMFLISLKSTSNGDDTALDLKTANDGAHGSLYDLILREVAPLMAHAVDGTTGVMSVVVDSHANTAASIASRIEALSGVGTDTTVEAAASFAVTA